MLLLQRCRTVVGVGKNYMLHVKEMGGKAAPTEPVLFLKSVSSLLAQGSPIMLPRGIGEVHHEIELGLVMGKHTERVSREDALDHVGAIVCAIDLTARDAQQRAKDMGMPWTRAKALRGFCPVSSEIPFDASSADAPDLDNVGVWLTVNGEERQRGNTSDMIFDVRSLISNISEAMTLSEGDLILTGTPSGVGPIAPGDVVEGGLEGICDIKFDVLEGP